MKRKTAASNEQSSFASGPNLMKLYGFVLCQPTWKTHWVLSQQFLFCFTLSDADISMSHIKFISKAFSPWSYPLRSNVTKSEIFSFLEPRSHRYICWSFSLWNVGLEQYFNGKNGGIGDGCFRWQSSLEISFLISDSIGFSWKPFIPLRHPVKYFSPLRCTRNTYLLILICL